MRTPRENILSGKVEIRVDVLHGLLCYLHVGAETMIEWAIIHNSVMVLIGFFPPVKHFSC